MFDLWQDFINLFNPNAGFNKAIADNYTPGSEAWKYGQGNLDNPYYHQLNNLDSAVSNLDLGNPKGSFGTQLWDGFTDQFTRNPIGNTLGIAGGLFGLWNGFNQYKMQKQGLAMAKDAYNFQKQVALNNERRNQEQWDMLKRQRASSSL